MISSGIMKSQASITAIIITQLLLLRCPESKALQLTSLGSLYEDLSPQLDDDASPLDNTMTVDSDNSYGVDHSFPIQHEKLVINNDGKFDIHERQLSYDNFMAGCKATEKGPKTGRCVQAEAKRIETNLLQPSNMKNYTKLGYEKVAVPPKLEEQLTRFWNTQEEYHRMPTKSNIEIGSTYFNHWESDQFMRNIDDDKFRSKHLRSLVWDETQPILEEWAGTELTPSSLLGVQIFTDKSVIPHRVDTLPFVINAIIHVADDLHTPWPIEVYSHDGKAHNITLGVGEMLLYEGTSVIVGRPYPLRGTFNAEILVSFEPMGYSRQHYPQDDESSLESLYLKSWRAPKIDVDDKEIVPSYLEQNSEEFHRWRQNYPKARLNMDSVLKRSVHTAAADGDLDTLKALEMEDPKSIFYIDVNGWTALHEAVRGGHIGVVEYLIDKGLDINLRTHHGTGGSPLWWAKHVHGKTEHKIIQYLQNRGALDIAPDEK